MITDTAKHPTRKGNKVLPASCRQIKLLRKANDRRHSRDVLTFRFSMAGTDRWAVRVSEVQPSRWDGRIIGI